MHSDYATRRARSGTSDIMKHCVIRRVRPTNSKLTVMRSTDESFEENYGAPRELALPTRLLEPGPCADDIMHTAQRYWA